MLTGFPDATVRHVVGVPDGVVRATVTRPGRVAVVVGGGSGHYHAFCGVVGPGFADGAVVGNLFTSPSAAEAASVARAAGSGAGMLLITGNYAGDVMNFTRATERLAADGITAPFLLVTDDIAGAPPAEMAQAPRHRRRHHRLQGRLRRRRGGAPTSTRSSGWPGTPTAERARSGWPSTAAPSPARMRPCSAPWRRFGAASDCQERHQPDNA